METRLAEEGDTIRRRRQCAACEKRFTTYEKPEVNFPAIVKKDGRRIEYDRSKLRASMNLDKVAYVRFASVYRSFEDIDEFKTLVDEVRR